MPPLATPMVVVSAISRYLPLSTAFTDIIMLKIVMINSNLVSSEIKCAATKNHTDQIKNKSQDLLVNTTSIATRRVARDF